MKTINCLIIDDTSESIEQLSNQLKKLIFANITSCTTYDEAFEILRKSSKYDIIFLDMHLQDKLGLHLVEAFPKLPPVIVISAYTHYAQESFDEDIIVDYLLKPCSDLRLLRAINRALVDNQYWAGSIADESSVFLKTGRKITKFNYEQIDYVEAYGVYSKVFSKSSLTLVNESISSVEIVLPKKQFIRIHKSYVINISKITSYDHKHFYINDLKIPMGASYKPFLAPLLRIFND